nr:DUF979 family protein [Paraburkholderia sp. UCT2]
MISLTWFFWLLGVLLFVIGGVIVSDRDHPKRWLAGGFWMLYGVVFLAGDVLPTAVTGVIVIAMALVAGFGGVTGAKPRVRGEAELRERAKQLGNRLFVPALTIPAVTVVGTLLSAHLVFGSHALLDPKNVTLVSFGIGCIVALALACRLTRDTIGQSIRETRRLIDALF